MGSVRPAVAAIEGGAVDPGSVVYVLALLVGAMLIASGLFRLGGIANLLSVPVTVGFLAGISVHILVSQMPGVLGLSSPSGPTLQRIAELARHVGEANPYTVVIGFGVLAVVAISEEVNAKIPGALIALVGATIAVIAADLERKGVAVVGTVPASLPMPSLPGDRRRRSNRSRSCVVPGFATCARAV